MPKSKPDQVITHRIELQKSERDMIETALVGRFATNAVSATGDVLTGMGNLLSPFAPVFGALVALWIGDRTLDAVRADGEARKEKFEREYTEGRHEYDALITGWLNTQYAEGGWDAVCSQENRADLFNGQFKYLFGYRGGLGRPIPIWLFQEFAKFLNTICESGSAKDSGKTPTELWFEWMTDDRYGAGAYYADTNGSTWEALKKGLGDLF